MLQEEISLIGADFGKNIAEWVKGIVWQNGKDQASNPIVPNNIDFVAFNDSINASSGTLPIKVDVYIEQMAKLMHDWFIQISSF